MTSLPNVQAQVNDGSEIDSRRQSSVDREETNSDREASEEQEDLVIDITEERTGLLSGVLTDEESQKSTPNEVKFINCLYNNLFLLIF
jgi:hypothetical protein